MMSCTHLYLKQMISATMKHCNVINQAALRIVVDIALETSGLDSFGPMSRASFKHPREVEAALVLEAGKTQFERSSRLTGPWIPIKLGDIIN